MNTQINSQAVKNEVFNIQAETAQTPARRVNKGVLMFIAYVTAAVGTLILLNSLGLIPKD